MKKLIIIAIMAIGSFGICEVQAQYVETVGGKIFIDVQDMPAGTWTTASLNSEHNENSSTNTLYKRFEVAKSNEALNLTWAGAKAACAAKAGGGWRLPTLYELVIMYMLKEALVAAKADPFSLWHCSSTDTSFDATSFWCYNMNAGGATGVKKTNTSNSVRCIREVTN